MTHVRSFTFVVMHAEDVAKD